MTGTHFPRPNEARTHCRDCGRLIRETENGPVHTRRPAPGRPRSKPRDPEGARVAAADWHAATERLAVARAEAREARADAMRRLVASGMVVSQIAEVTGLTKPGVEYWIRVLKLKPRKLDATTITTSSRTVLARVKRTRRSTLLG